MKYATTKTFDGQRASLGRVVIARSCGGILEGGMIVALTDDDERVFVRLLDSAYVSSCLAFVPTKTEEDINALPEGSWTWPVRV
jgi:hypothetical protein